MVLPEPGSGVALVGPMLAPDTRKGRRILAIPPYGIAGRWILIAMASCSTGPSSQAYFLIAPTFAAAWISSNTWKGWETIEAWLDGTEMVVAFIRLAKNC